MVKRLEFMGIPGSGKTTLCNLVYDELKKSQKVELFKEQYKDSLKGQIRNQGNGLIGYLRFVLLIKLLRGSYIPASTYGEEIIKYMVEHSNIYTNLLNTIVTTAVPERRNYILKYLLMDIYKWGVVKKDTSNQNLILMDEGFVHRVLNIYMYSENNNLDTILKEFFLTIEFPEVVVNVKCDIDNSINRMEKRKQGIPVGYRIYKRNEFRKVLVDMEEFNERLLSYLKKEGVKIIEVQNSNLSVAKNEIISALY
ncbi:hypothetical protein ABE096_01520 [Robertmurraya massiliosenegalensis]|uniref:hypothetical protein n=1 Tax=Robertmurraya TaxID=2837507 RepID=UPI0039A59019